MVAFLVLGACGRLRFEERSDVGVDVDLAGAFGSPTRVSELDDAAGIDDPSLTSDLLEIFYARDAAPNGDIWTATRSSASLPFGSMAPVTELNSTGDENTPAVSDDGLTIYFSSNRAPTLGVEDIWMATRPTRQSAWSAPIHVVELSSTAPDVGPQLTADGLHVVFNRDIGGAADLFVSSRPTQADAWATPVPIGELNTAARETDGWLSPDRLVLWFASDGVGTTGMRDLWMTRRAVVTDPWDPGVPVTEVSSTADDVDPWLSPDQRLLLFSSYRDGAEGIYMARR